MHFRLGIENDNDDRTIAWALEHPGCFAYGADEAEACLNFPAAAASYAEWAARHGGDWLRSDEPITSAVEETFDVYYVDPAFEIIPRGSGGMVESFFRYDWKPLTASDIERALKLLAWSRLDLMETVQALTPGQLSRQYPGERWDITGILNHIGSAEWWYQERIGYPSPVDEEQLPSDPFERLPLVRSHYESLLPQLEGLNRVIGLNGEIWSPRKVLRRALWHERDHTEHIRKLLRSG